MALEHRPALTDEERHIFAVGIAARTLGVPQDSEEDAARILALVESDGLLTMSDEALMLRMRRTLQAALPAERVASG